MEIFKNIYILRINFGEGILYNHVIDACKFYLNLNHNLNTFYITVASFENETAYDNLLDLIFNSSRRSITSLSLSIPVNDTSNKLLTHLTNCDTIVDLTLCIEADKSIRFGPTKEHYILSSITKFRLDGYFGSMADDFILDYIHFPNLRELTFHRIKLSQKMEDFVKRHSSSLTVLNFESDILEWNFNDILGCCTKLTDLTVRYPILLPPIFAHASLTNIRIDQIWKGIKFDDVVEGSLRIAQELDRFLKVKPIYFPQLHNIQLLDFSKFILKYRDITEDMANLWTELLTRCEKRSIALYDQHMSLMTLKDIPLQPTLWRKCL